MFNGNALNVARSPGQADQLLEWGIEIERNLSLLISKPFVERRIVIGTNSELFYHAINI